MKWWQASDKFSVAQALVDELGIDTQIKEASLGAKFTVQAEDLERTLALAARKNTKFWTSVEACAIIVYILGAQQ